MGSRSSTAENCGVGIRHNLDPALLWPVAAAPIQPIAWELLYAACEALKSKKKKKKKKKNWELNLGFGGEGKLAKKTEMHSWM